MTPKQILSKKFRKRISPDNMLWFEKYQNESGDPSGYYLKVQEFLEFCAYKNNKDIRTIDETDVNSYITVLKSCGAKTPTINSHKSALSGLRKFLHSNYPDTFDERFLSELPGHERTDENPTEIKALSLVQLSYVRAYNRSHLKDNYIFELFFQLGIDKNDLVARNFPESRNAEVDEIIKKASKSDIELGTINSYFKRVTKYLRDHDAYDKSRRNINSYDLAEGRNAYFLRCPNCGKSFENVAKYWVLARVNIEEVDYQGEYSIVCAECKGAR